MPRKRIRRPIEDRVRIEHMLEAGRDIVAFMNGRSNEEFRADRLLQRAVSNAAQQIGEAAANVSDMGRDRVPDLPWKQIVAMRHIMVHVYWGIDLERLWVTATQDVPLLLSLLNAACADWPLPPSAPDGPPEQAP